MAIMYNMAQDWTFDLFMEDSKLYHETQMKGVYDENTSNYRKYFMRRVKNVVRDFRADWSKTRKSDWDKDGHEWIGDAFMREFDWGWFSDFYKDAYGQRPHLSKWYYVQAFGLPTIEDIGRRFCASPVENAMERAKEARENC